MREKQTVLSISSLRSLPPQEMQHTSSRIRSSSSSNGCTTMVLVRDRTEEIDPFSSTNGKEASTQYSAIIGNANHTNERSTAGTGSSNQLRSCTVTISSLSLGVRAGSIARTATYVQNKVYRDDLSLAKTGKHRNVFALSEHGHHEISHGSELVGMNCCIHGPCFTK